MDEKVLSGEVSWINKIDSFELDVYKTYLELSGPGEVPSNKAIAKKLDVSRNAISRARRRIAHKLDLKAGW